MLVPYPADLVRGVVLILGKPKLPLFANHVEYLNHSNQHILIPPSKKKNTVTAVNVPLQRHRSNKDSRPPSLLDRY